jgi:hypothetical protein
VLTYSPTKYNPNDRIIEDLYRIRPKEKTDEEFGGSVEELYYYFN